MLRDTTAPLAADDGLHDIFVHTRDLGEKDLHHALDLGAELGVDLPMAQLAHDAPRRRRSASRTTRRHHDLPRKTPAAPVARR